VEDSGVGVIFAFDCHEAGGHFLVGLVVVCGGGDHKKLREFDRGIVFTESPIADF
jgi:hypothetical protein